MNRIISILSIIVVILIILLIGSVKRISTLSNDVNRWKSNYKEVQQNTSRLQMTLKEFKDQLESNESEIDSLLNKLSIKPKQVERVVYLTVSDTIKDTISVEVIKDNTAYGFEFTKNIGCFGIKGNLGVDTTLTTLFNEPIPILTFTELTYNNSSTYLAYEDRKQWKFLFIKSKLFGKKTHELEINSECGDIKCKEIEIIKRK